MGGIAMEFIGKAEDDMLLEGEGQIIIYGAGQTGKRAFEILKQKGLETKIVAFCDRNETLYDKKLYGILILSVAEACRQYPEAAFIVAGMCVRQMVENLQKYEVQKIHIIR